MNNLIKFHSFHHINKFIFCLYIKLKFKLMNFIEETLHASLTKDLSCSVLEQLQNSNSALQELLYRLSSTRDCPKSQAVQTKIQRVQNFKFVKQSVLEILQNDENAVVYQWIQNSFYSCNPFLYQLIKKEEITLSIKKSIYQIVKQTFLSDQTLEDHLEQNQLAKQCLQKLNQLKQQKQKIPSRLFVKQVDQKCQRLDLIIANFNKKVQKFNFLIWSLIKRIFDFQQRISKNFISFINNDQNKQRVREREYSSKNQSNKNSRILQIQSKNSEHMIQNRIDQQNFMQNQDSNVNINIAQKKKYQNYKPKPYSSQKEKSTPRKKLNTDEELLQNNFRINGNFIEANNNVYDYRQPSRPALLRNYDKVTIPTRDQKRLTLTNNFVDPPKVYQSELLNNFNKTLQDLSYHRQRGSYLMQNPAPISLISQNVNKQKNTRSSISYNNSRSGSSFIYPMR